MAVLSGVHETFMARDNATNIMLQLGRLRHCNSQQRCSAQCCGAALLQIALLRWCGAAARIAATLQRSKLWRCGVASYDTTTLRRSSSRGCNAAPLRMAATLWRCNSHGCGAERGWWRYGVIASVAVTLQLALLRHCSSLQRSSAIASVAVTLQLALLRHCSSLQRCGCDGVTLQFAAFFFNYNDSWQV
jgi:hypothetical protein